MSALNVVGLIPAAGQAKRLTQISGSKELVQVGSKAVSECLLGAFRSAGITTTFFILAPGKWDIPEYFGGGESVGSNLAYLVRRDPYGVPYTIDTAYPFVQDCNVAFGFPDIIFEPQRCFVDLADRQSSTEADILLGVFPVDEPAKWGAVVLDDDEKISRIVTRPHNETTCLTWILALWTPAFSQFLHEFVANREGVPEAGLLDGAQIDVSMGVAIQSAMDAGLRVDHVTFSDGWCLDIGTPEDLEKARRNRYTTHP